MIKRKTRASDRDWLDATKNIEQIISKDHIENKVLATVSEIKTTATGKCAYSWSGGKDSVVLGMICELAGVKESVFVHTDLEYTAFMDWVDQNIPDLCEPINTGQNLEWLSRNENMLFPQEANTAARWFHIVQHKGQAEYYKKRNLDLIILGRRKADGNYVGRGSNIYTNKQGVTRYSPIADWTHEEVLACIHYFDLGLPPIYGWKKGYLCGTHPWPARQHTGDLMSGYREVYEIESGLVEDAAEYLESARRFLEEV